MTPSKPPKATPKPRYVRWRARNPDLYRKRQRLYMRKRRAVAKLTEGTSKMRKPPYDENTMVEPDMKALITQLTEGGGYISHYPVPPDEAAEMIVTTLLSDLPTERQAAVKKAITEWGREWGSAVGSTVLESASY